MEIKKCFFCSTDEVMLGNLSVHSLTLKTNSLNSKVNIFTCCIINYYWLIIGKKTFSLQDPVGILKINQVVMPMKLK